MEQRFATGEITQQDREIEHAKIVAGFAGGWGGAIAGAEGGAIVGGLIGGPIGAPIGGVIGGIGGYFGGDAVAEAGAQWTLQTLHSSGNTIADSADSVWEATLNSAQAGGDAASRAWHWAWGE